MALDAFGVLVAKGSFKVQLGTVTELGSDRALGGTGTAKDTIYQAMALTLGVDAFTGAQPVQVFIGVGGSLQGPAGTPNDFSDDVLNTDSGVGFLASLDRLSAGDAEEQQRHADPGERRQELPGARAERHERVAWSASTASSFGVYQAGVKVNQAKDTDNNAATNPAKLDLPASSTTPAASRRPRCRRSTAGVDTEVQGSVALDAFGVVIAKGSFKRAARHGDRARCEPRPGRRRRHGLPGDGAHAGRRRLRRGAAGAAVHRCRRCAAGPSTRPTSPTTRSIPTAASASSPRSTG